jgi:hypothetical protein
MAIRLGLGLSTIIQIRSIFQQSNNGIHRDRMCSRTMVSRDSIIHMQGSGGREIPLVRVSGSGPHHPYQK